MTTLRDDGYLETDDPVVAACFLGKAVIGLDGAEQVQFTLRQITRYAGIDQTAMTKRATAYLYPIRIPAATVAEVANPKTPSGYIVYLILLWKSQGTGSATHSKDPLSDWLRTHTEPTDE